MVKAQKWLDKKYPNKEERSKITELNDGGIHNFLDVHKKIEGHLDLRDFVNLEEIRFSELGQLTSLDISNCPKLVKLNCSQNLINNLNLSKNTMLVELYCSGNQLRELDTTNCPNLKIIRCDNNLLTNLDLTTNQKLECLSIKDNNFAKQDLSFLTHLTNLKVLELGNDNPRRIKKGLYNQFVGSLESLKGITELEKLNINNTDLDSGLEHLGNSVSLYCSSEKRPNSQVKKIEEQVLLNAQLSKKRSERLSISSSQTADDQSTVSSLHSSLQASIQQQDEEEEKGKWSNLIKQTKEKKGEKLTKKEVALLDQIRQLKEENSQLKKDKIELEKEITWFKFRDLEQSFQIKKTELDELLFSIKDELNEKGQKSLTKLLEAQKELLENNIPYVQKQLEKAKSKLSEQLTEEKIQSLCDKQIKIVELEKQLNELQVQKQDKLQQAQIIQLTYGIPSSSKN